MRHERRSTGLVSPAESSFGGKNPDDPRVLRRQRLLLMDMNTVTSWLQSFGWRHEALNDNTLCIFRAQSDSRSFFLRNTTNWLLLTVVNVLPAGAHRPADLSRRLLAVNRDIHLAKFAYDEDGDVILAAELPTESLDASELRDAVERISRYVEHYRTYFSAPAPGT
ncbi:MAG: YbjN domain-containing protein [Polyangiaceae bacterium]|jgi:hypothetical protein|nr:YbjN domain-containing protein [Polyangiaceae bacterium]